MHTSFVIGDRGLGTSGDTHPAWMMAHAEMASYLIVGASTLGKLHLARNLPRDDAFVIRSAGPWLAVAIADGVGSRPLSRYGATYVVEALSALVLRQLTSPIKALKQEPGTDVLSAANQLALPASLDAAEFKNLAPPPTVEEQALKLSVACLPIEPDKQDRSSEPSSINEYMSQAGSIAWWPSFAPPRQYDQHTTATPLAATSRPAIPTTEDDQEQAKTAPIQSPGDEPALHQVIRHAFDNTYRGLLQHANNLDVELTDLSCTALVLLLNTETGCVAAGQIGDGALLGLTAQGQVIELVQAPDTGDPQSVYTINRPNFAKHLSINVIEPSAANPFRAFYVMTDGISSDLLYSPRPVENWAQSIDAVLQASSSPARAASGMLNWLSTYEVKGSWDDRTLVVIMQREQ
jgi:hypothetical protein